MSEPFIAEIKMFGGNFAPRGWAFCDGQLLPINQNSALFSLLGTTYGGDGRTTFGLPDLRGRVAVGPRRGPGLSDYKLGQRGGVETTAGGGGISTTTAEAAPGLRGGTNVTAVTSVTASGSGASTTNIQPYLAVNYIIALEGIFPPRS